MVATGQTGISCVADGLSLLHLVTHLHRDPAHVPVKGLQPHAVVDDHTLPVDAEIVCPYHFAPIRDGDVRVSQTREVDAEMGLLIDQLAVREVAAVLGKGPFWCGMRHTEEITLPE